MSKKKLDENEMKKLEEKHESDLTPQEKRQLEKYKLSGMGWKGKIEYIWAYYKPAIFGVVAVIALLFLVKDMYHNSKIHSVLSVFIVDAGGIDTEPMSTKIQELLGYSGEYEPVQINTNLMTDESGVLQYQSQMVFMTMLAAREIDVMLLPESLYESLAGQETFASLRTEVLGEEAFDALGAEGDDYHILVDAAALSDYYGSYYEPVCIAVAANSENMENAARWIASLAG